MMKPNFCTLNNPQGPVIESDENTPKNGLGLDSVILNVPNRATASLAIPKVKIDAREARDLVKSGATLSELMAAFKISIRGVRSLLTKLAASGVLEEWEITDKVRALDQASERRSGDDCKLFQVKHRYTAEVLFSGAAPSMKALVEAATALGVDLSYADLAGLDLSGARLVAGRFNGASFDKTNLAAADLSGAQLCQASLMAAELVGALCCGADLCGADLTQCNLAHIDGATSSLTGADLSESNLTHANLEAADLGGAVLFRAVLDHTKLEGACLTGTDLAPDCSPMR
jgi:uncharacterized protein YjbI with pentapeptide repeats